MEQKIEVSSIRLVEEVKDRSWLMKSTVFYFKVVIDENDKDIMFATHHSTICHRWVHHIKTAIFYLQHAQYIKPIPAADQIVEFLDDQKG